MLNVEGGEALLLKTVITANILISAGDVMKKIPASAALGCSELKVPKIVVVLQMKKGSQREKHKSWLLCYLCTAGQSWHEVSVNVRLMVSESYRNGWTKGMCCMFLESTVSYYIPGVCCRIMDSQQQIFVLHLKQSE